MKGTVLAGDGDTRLRLCAHGDDVLENAPKLRLEFSDVDRGRVHARCAAATIDSRVSVGEFVRTLEKRQGMHVPCLEKTASRVGFVDRDECRHLGEATPASASGEYVMAVAEQEHLLQAASGRRST